MHGAKVGSEFDALLSDASILLSILIQIGYDSDKIAKALGRCESGERASIIGAMADLLADEAEAEHAEPPSTRNSEGRARVRREVANRNNRLLAKTWLRH